MGRGAKRGFLTTKDAAGIAGVSTAGVTKWIRDGYRGMRLDARKIPANVGRPERYEIPAVALRDFLAARSRKAVAS